MRMVYVDGTDQVLVINQGGEFTATQGVCSHEYFELDKGFLTGRAPDLRAAPVAVRPDDGEPIDPPAELPLEVYPVVVEERSRIDRGGRRPSSDERGVGLAGDPSPPMSLVLQGTLGNQRQALATVASTACSVKKSGTVWPVAHSSIRSP
jgi:nitrite reductase/ring-hydroxylating ferredoxin subunit